MTRIRSLVAGLVLVACAPGAGADDKPAKLDAAKLVGTYAITSGVKDGKKSEADALKTLTLTVTKDEMALKTPEGTFKFGYKVDAAKTPAEVDLEILDGPVGKGAKSKGIIALDGDTIKIAYHPMEGDRPKDFDAKEGTGVYSFTAKKAEAKKEK